MRLGLRHLTGIIYTLAFVVFLLFGFVSCSDTELPAVTATQVCNIEPPFSKDRTILQVDTVEHEYDDCASELVYYIPIPGDTVYPPCGDHGGSYVTDFGSEYWGCIDGTIRNFSQGVGRIYSTGETGLATGESYGTYFRVIASSVTSAEDTATVVAQWTPSSLNADPSQFTLTYDWLSAGQSGNTSDTTVTFRVVKTDIDQSFDFCITPVRIPDNVSGLQTCKSYTIPATIPIMDSRYEFVYDTTRLGRSFDLSSGDTIPVGNYHFELLRADGAWNSITSEATMPGIDSVKFYRNGSQWQGRERSFPYEVQGGTKQTMTVGNYTLEYRVFGDSAESRTYNVRFDSIISPPDTTPPGTPTEPPPNVTLVATDSSIVVAWDEWAQYDSLAPSPAYWRLEGGIDGGGGEWADTIPKLASDAGQYERTVTLTAPAVLWACVVGMFIDGSESPAGCDQISWAPPDTTPGMPYDPSVDTLLYVPHVTAYHPDRNQDSVISRYAQAPVGNGSTFAVDSGKTSLLAWIRLERRDGNWEKLYGPHPNDTSEAQQRNIAGVDSVKFWLDGVFTNREGAYTYEMFPGGSRDPIPLTVGQHDIRYQVFGNAPESRTVTIVVLDSITPTVNLPSRPAGGIDHTNVDYSHAVEVAITLRNSVTDADTVIWQVRNGNTGTLIEQRRLPTNVMTQTFTILKENESYPLRFRWWGKNVGGEGPFADDAVGTIPADISQTQIDFPEGVSVVAVTDNSITLSVENTNTEGLYRFYFQPLDSNEWINSATFNLDSNTVEHQFVNLSLNETYRIGVAILNGNRESLIIYQTATTLQ